ncbi:MAG: hypothetical protein J7M19_01765 [Planctomycetes bacterium]|nr:hypothetical protein [Planctomycetota bacterium]
MAVVHSTIDFRDYIRVIFSRAWWFLFVVLGVVALAFWWSFYRATRIYEATNEIAVTDRYSSSLSKNIGRNPDWVTRVMKAELELKRPVPARAIITDAASAVGVDLTGAEITSMVGRFKGEMKLAYSKKGDFIELSYRAKDGRLAAGVLNLFMKRLISYCVTMQVEKLNTEVATLSALRTRLDGEVAAAQKKLDMMKTVDPELRLTADTMALLGSGKRLSTTPSTEQAVHVFLQIQRDIIDLDAGIADSSEWIEGAKRQIAAQPEAVPLQRRLETVPAVREALKRRDQLRLELAELLANSTAEHPLVKEAQGQLKGLDAFLKSAATQTTVEVVFQPNARRIALEKEVAARERDVEGLRKRRAKMEESAAKWREKLDRMPSELRIVREATLEYEKKTQNLSNITDSLVHAQIKRSLEIDQVGTYYQPQWNLTPVPSTYKQPRHVLHIALGLVLGLVASVFAVYAIEFADHSVKDQRDLKAYTKAAVLGVISDYNQLKAVAVRARRARAKSAKTYALVVLYLALAAFLVWVGYRKWPRPDGHESLPPVLSAASVVNINEAMKMYAGSAADLYEYVGQSAPKPEVAPAVEVPDDLPEPLLTQ